MHIKNVSLHRLTFFEYSLHHGNTTVPASPRNSSVRYCSTFIPFAQAVAAMEYIIALASAPFNDAENSQFLRPTHKDLTAFSTRLLSIGISRDKIHLLFENMFIIQSFCSLFAWSLFYHSLLYPRIRALFGGIRHL